MAKITKDNIDEQIIDVYKARGFTVTERSYSNTWDVKKANSNYSISFDLNRDSYGDYYVTVSYNNRKLKHPNTVIKHLDKFFTDHEAADLKDKITANAHNTAKKMLEVFGFEEEDVNIYAYDSKVSASTPLANFKDDTHGAYTYSEKEKISMSLWNDGRVTYQIQTNNLDIELLKLVEDKVEKIKNAWEISVL